MIQCRKSRDQGVPSRPTPTVTPQRRRRRAARPDKRVVHHRYYDPAVAQFLSVDPLVDLTGAPYAFTGGNPVNLSDPNGLLMGPNGDTCVNPTACALQGSMTQRPDMGPCIPSGALTGGQVGSTFGWGSVFVDGATGYATGLGYRASALGSVLRGGSSYAGGALRAAGETAQMWEPLADAAIPFGGGITFASDVANGQGIGRSAANAIGTTAGGYVGSVVGGLVCGSLAAATEGVGSLTCGVFTGVGAVVGGIVGGAVANGVSDVIRWF